MKKRVTRYLLSSLYTKQLLIFRESEGTFEFGNYRKEVSDLHAVVQHFTTANRVISAILGHSKGISFCNCFTRLKSSMDGLTS